MHLFDLMAVLVSAAALFSWVNYRWLKLPNTLGVMLIALILSLGLASLRWLGIDLVSDVEAVIAAIDFNEALLHGMLSFLLFAGALHVDLASLRRHRWEIGIMASIGVVISTFIVGVGAWGLFALLGIPIALIWCLVFGALISPTDPIAVMATLKKLGAPKALEVKIAGESLFNDGMAMVVFIVLLGIATGTAPATFEGISKLFLMEAVGGVIFGLALGLLGLYLLRGVNRYDVEILLTLAIVMGGYALAFRLHASAPIAIVVAGLMLGNHGRTLVMSDESRQRLDDFWELIDEILNAILFLLIGIEVLVLTFNGQFLLAGALLIPIVLLARLISVGAPITALRMRRTFPRRTVRILTWGGLRGGVSVALALSLPQGEVREQILVCTYVVVLFSLLVQGTTLGRLLPPKHEQEALARDP